MSKLPLLPPIQLLLPEQGRSQSQRLTKGLAQDYVAIDERSESEMFDLLRQLSEQLKFYSNDPAMADSNWQAFFPFALNASESWFADNNGKIPPHLALLKTFLEHYFAGPVIAQNRLKDAYISYYYEHVLQFSKRPAAQPKAHVVCSLKKGAPAVLITPENKLSAGKREDGSVISVSPVQQSVINHASIVEQRTVFSSTQQPSTLKVAPIAQSLDGLGEELPKDNDSWSAFGHEGLPVSEQGFALASPILKLSEGQRQVQIEISLTESLNLLLPQISALDSAFNIIFTSTDGWSDSQAVSVSVSGRVLLLRVDLAPSVPPIVEYSSAVHGFAFDTQAPVVQCILTSSLQQNVLVRLLNAHIDSIRINVAVAGVRDLTIVSDIGPVSPDAAFFPFGPLPKYKSRLSLKNSEVFAKRIESMSVHFAWKSVTKKLADFYQEYAEYESMPSIDNGFFTANVKLTDGAGREIEANNMPLFNSADAGLTHTIGLSQNSISSVKLSDSVSFAQQLGNHKSQWAKKEFNTLLIMSPQFRFKGNTGVTQGSRTEKRGSVNLGVVKRDSLNEQGIEFSLNQSFFHEEYRKAYVKSVLAASKSAEVDLVSDPYTPELSAISLDYSAYTQTVSFSNPSVQAFANNEVQFFHMDVFGQRREHAYQRQQLSYVSDKRVSLFAKHEQKCAFYLGLADLGPGDSCQILFQVLEGSANPSLTPATIRWSILCDNYFKVLESNELIFDNTDNLQTSGIVSFIVPKQATTENTIMPSGLIWLRLSIDGEPASLCKLRSIQTNAILAKAEAAQTATNIDNLPAGCISKFISSLPNIKQISQPYDGFGGASEESDADFTSRVSARLRHKDRAISCWDYETLVLEHFPNIHRVKTVPHSQPNNWQSPGHITVLIVPYVNPVNSAEPLTPKVSVFTINEINRWLASRMPMQAQTHVINPSYVFVRMSISVAFSRGTDQHVYKGILDKMLQTFFAPWTSQESNALGPEFGGRVYKSVVLDFIEQLEFVDYLEDIAMQASFDGEIWQDDCSEIRPTAPDQILTSALAHNITVVAND